MEKLMATKNPERPPDELGSLADSVDRAIVVIEEVRGRLKYPPARDLAENVALSLVGFLLDLQRFVPVSASGACLDAWVLNSHWHPLVFEMASSSEKVLLTVAANAVRAVKQHCELVLHEGSPLAGETELAHQRWVLSDMERSVRDMRASMIETCATSG